MSEKSCTCHNCNCGLCTASIELFSNLAIDAQQKLTSMAIHTNYRKGDIILNESDPVSSIRIIRDGRVKINTYDIDGKETILDILTKGDIIGEDVFLDNTTSPFNYTCLTSVKICEIKKEYFIDLMLTHPQAAINLINNLSKKLNLANERIQILTENDALLRLSSFLLSREFRLKGENIKLSLDDIAASINLRKETVSRKLNELQDLDLIIREGNKNIKVKNTADLAKYCNKNL
ncbi:MAG: Crp/Fnr family transcriptional regulator [Peptostreptococcus sp.]|uniref:Crp/Fnr family transcriptional regulator n=1 Tax=Peptostreptococcus sp. TaxID=1262 RepID=UPI002FC8BE0E